MFQVLVESRAALPRQASWTAFSFAAHSAAIAGALILTAKVAPDLRPPDPVPGIIYVAPSPVPPPPAVAPMLDVGAPRPFVLSHPVYVPDVIPPIATPAPDLFSRVIDDLSRTTVGTITGGNPVVTVGSGGVHTAATVDRVVAPLSGNGSPAYPSRLSSAGVEGDVSVRFVVDTTGRVEASSVEILQASHAQFGEAVKQWLTKTRYAPAVANGRPVRQLVLQRVGFTITR